MGNSFKELYENVKNVSVISTKIDFDLTGFEKSVNCLV